MQTRMTSLFDPDRTIQYVGGPWDGSSYTPMRGAAYPAHLHAAWSGELHLYVCKRHGDSVAYEYMGKCLPDGSVVA